MTSNSNLKVCVTICTVLLTLICSSFIAMKLQKHLSKLNSNVFNDKSLLHTMSNDRHQPVASNYQLIKKNTEKHNTLRHSNTDTNTIGPNLSATIKVDGSVSTVIPAFNTGHTPHICKHSKVLWFLSAGYRGDDRETGDFQTLEVAIQSAREYAPSLIPIVLYHGDRHIALPHSLLNSSQHSAIELQHQLTFHEHLDKYNVDELDYSSYYPIDIGAIMKKLTPKLANISNIDTNYVLFSDSNVLFFRDIDGCSISKSRVIAFAPADLYTVSQVDTTIAYINVKNMHTHLAPILKYTDSKSWDFGAGAAHYMMYEYFRSIKLYNLLPIEYNWRSDWGENNNTCDAYERKIYHCDEELKEVERSVDEGKYYDKLLKIYKEYTNVVSTTV